MWPLLLVGVFVLLGLAPRRVTRFSTPLALLSVVAVVGFKALNGHLL